MIAYSYIKANLHHLDREYTRSASTREASYRSKMAILELCGWIEMSMDDAIIRAGARLLKNPKSIKLLNTCVKRNYGFLYEPHFQSLVIFLIGVSGCELIESKINTDTFTNFKGDLKTLKTSRDELAHTYTKGTTQHYDSPSITLSRFQNISAGIKAYDEELRSLK